jgi:predicted esterase
MPLPSDAAPLLRHAPATVHGRYLVQPPHHGVEGLWLVGFHGYGQSAEVFLDALAAMSRDRRWRVVSVQALHPFYAGRSEQVVANWMTRQDRELAIADNVAYVDAVLDQLEREFGAPRAIVFAGFSQGVAMAYRAGLLGRRTCAAVIACGGDVPPEFEHAKTRDWPAVLAATGRGDAYYPPERLERDLALLRTRRPDARMLVFEGGHEWPAALAGAAGALLDGIEGALPA